MIEPVAEHAAQQIGAAQKWAVGGRRSAHRKVISAAGAAVVTATVFDAYRSDDGRYGVATGPEPSADRAKPNQSQKAEAPLTRGSESSPDGYY